SYRDYGNRVGFWRMLEPLDRYNIRCCVSLNLAVLEHFQEVTEAMVQRDWDFMSHGIYNTRYLYAYTEEQEREFYRTVLRPCAATTASRLKACLARPFPAA
ncbi:MAG TPA: polysaccharide deacetylase, partial [Dehalococcoidia bacterium]|nr:polysaccharide deacetylase [Dehalococcoidia bacterium]